MPWLPLSLDQLRIGMFIKLNHRWIEHPFVRNTFMISSPSEIAIIHKHRLQDLLYDPDRSHTDAIRHLTTYRAPAVMPILNPTFQPEDVDHDEETLRKEKAIHLEHRESLHHAKRQYAQQTMHCMSVLEKVCAGNSESVQDAFQLITAMMDLLQKDSVTLSVVLHVDSDSRQRLAHRALNVTALACMTGKTMALSESETQCLGLGALFHNIGKQAMSAGIRLRAECDLSEVEQRSLRAYPQAGKALLARLGQFPPEVLDIVHHHREHLDGSGFPQGLQNGAIAKLARIVGTASVYQALTESPQSASAPTPTYTLSRFYQTMHQTYGADVIQSFIATITIFPPGSFVRLNDGQVGMVVKPNCQDRLRPIVLLYDPHNVDTAEPVIDLSRERGLSITSSLTSSALPPPVLKALRQSGFYGFTLAPHKPV